MSRQHLKRTIEHFTGHCEFRKLIANLELEKISERSKCGEKDEIFLHIICQCFVTSLPKVYLRWLAKRRVQDLHQHGPILEEEIHILILAVEAFSLNLLFNY